LRVPADHKAPTVSIGSRLLTVIETNGIIWRKPGRVLQISRLLAPITDSHTAKPDVLDDYYFSRLRREKAGQFYEASVS
jgi:hypothetical protein